MVKPKNVDVGHHWRWGGGRGGQNIITVLFVRENIDNFRWTLINLAISDCSASPGMCTSYIDQGC